MSKSVKSGKKPARDARKTKAALALTSSALPVKDTPSTKPSRELDDDDRTRLHVLRILAEPGACLHVRAREGARHITITRRHGGISLSAGILSAERFDALIRQDLIGPQEPAMDAAKRAVDIGKTQGPTSSRRYVLSSSGAACLARANARAQPQTKESAFGAQHQALAPAPHGEAQHNAAPPLQNAKESPLAWLVSRRDGTGKTLISAAQFMAGERLRQDLTFAQMLPSLTRQFDNIGGATFAQGLTYSDHVIAARQRVNRAFAAVGADFCGLLMDVCGFLKGLDLVERERGWPQRSAKLILAMALTRLARHYGYDGMATGKSRGSSQKPVHWGTADYRPLLVD